MTKSFRKFYEAVDLFGFENGRDAAKTTNDELNGYPIRQFDIELMMNLLLRKKLGLHEADYSGFTNEIIWGGERPGAIKLEVDTGYTFYIKRLNYDLEGSKKWATKKMFQMNRRGLAGYEDIIANEIYDHMNRLNDFEIDYPQQSYDRLEKLSHKISQSMRRVGEKMFIFQGIKKLSEQCYHIVFEVQASGVGAPDQHRVENNVTQVSFDETTGTIRVNNYNIESPMKGFTWKPMPNDLDLYFYPTQSIDEICDCLAVHFKYY